MMKLFLLTSIFVAVLVAIAAADGENGDDYTLSLRVYGHGKTRRWPYGKLSFTVTDSSGKKSPIGGSDDDHWFCPYDFNGWKYTVDLPVDVSAVKSVGVTFANGDQKNTDPRYKIPFVVLQKRNEKHHLFVPKCNESVVPAGQEVQFHPVDWLGQGSNQEALQRGFDCMAEHGTDQAENNEVLSSSPSFFRRLGHAEWIQALFGRRVIQEVEAPGSSGSVNKNDDQ